MLDSKGEARPSAFEEFFAAEVAEHRAVLDRSLEALQAPFGAVVEMALRTLRGGGKLLFFGNGGSAADAQHLARRSRRWR
jgi:D-sedoheptulose 7-phosphate isomerase